jgi:flagellar export protein FliJ
MAIFDFRLQRVLEYREMQEGWAKEAYLAARSVRLQGEVELQQIRDERSYLLEHTPSDLNSRRDLEHRLALIEDRERAQHQILMVLGNEETNALAAWQNQKRELEMVKNLKESALEEFKLEESRREQAELDEWAVMRRAA